MNYVDNITKQKWVSDVEKIYLPDELQEIMFSSVKEIASSTSSLMKNPSDKNAEVLSNKVLYGISVGNRLERWLFKNNIIELKSEHLITAFSLLHLARVSEIDPRDHTESKIRGYFNRNLMYIGYKNSSQDDVSPISVNKIKVAMRWLLSGPVVSLESKNKKIETDQTRVIRINEGVLAWVDEREKLMWEIKNSDNYRYRYVWHTSYLKDIPVTGPDGVDCTYDTEIKDATSYVKMLNDNHYSGFNDWRLPVVAELETLIDREGAFRLVKKPLQENTYKAYWSDTPGFVVNVFNLPGSTIKDSAHIENVRIVDFDTGKTRNYSPKNSLWIRCVRNIE